MRYLFALAAILSVLVSLATPVGAAPADPDFAELDAFVAASMQDSGLPGVALAVVRGNRVVHMRGFGVADPSGRPVAPQTPFRIGSNTKGFTALAVMQLVEGGRIELDAPVQRYLPWFRLADPDASARITVRHLLNHTSGIPDGPENDSFLQPDLTLEQYARDLASVRPNGPPGAGYEYANANYNLLGLIVETVSGQPYADYLRQHVLAPLRMTRTVPGDQPDMARGYQWWFGLPRPSRDPFNQANLPAGYLSSTAEDLTHYVIAHLNGGRFAGAAVLSPAGIARMHEPGPNTDAFAPGRAGYGMGWGVGTVDGHTLVSHDGATWSYHSRLMFDVQGGWGVVLLTNADNLLVDSQPFRALAAGVVSRVSGLALPPPPGPGIRVAYGVVDPLVVLLSGLLLWSLARIVRSGPPRRRGWTLARAGLEGALGLLLLLLPPRVLGMSWSLVLVVFPDLGRWGIAAAGVLIATGAVRAVRALRASGPSGAAFAGGQGARMPRALPERDADPVPGGDTATAGRRRSGASPPVPIATAASLPGPAGRRTSDR